MPPSCTITNAQDLTDSDDMTMAETPTSVLSSPTVDNPKDTPDSTTIQKKKKKKKSKKSNKSKADSASSNAGNPNGQDGRHSVLCISRNKHWRYISSYHGPWLQLPIELLDSLLVLNLDPATFTAPSEPRLPSLASPPPSPSANRLRDRHYPQNIEDCNSSLDSSRSYAQLQIPAPIPSPKPGKATPPPIDPGVFRSVTSIRRLIDEAAELSVRASSGLSASELRGSNGMMMGGGNPWATAQSLGLGSMGGGTSNGRNVAMSAMRIHRLRALAVQKLAQAYKTDEIASSVMVMQGGSVFDDVAERVLKVDPDDVDAKYVHFFHEKIPSRQLAESTTTQTLNELIRAQPHRLEFYRTRGIVHCFRDEYAEASRDFTFTLKESRAQRKARMNHLSPTSDSRGNTGKTSKKKKGSSAGKINGQAPPNGTSAPDSVDGPDGEPLLLHPSVLSDAPDPIEPQVLFLRGAAHLQHAVYLIESTILELEGIRKMSSSDGSELRLCYIEDGRYGGVEIGHPDGPLGVSGGKKLVAYRAALADPAFREIVSVLLKKSIRDHERFIAHFDTLEGPSAFFDPNRDLAQRVEYAFLLSEAARPGNHGNMPPTPPNPASPHANQPTMYTTYHPLLVESHFSILISQMMLADFDTLLPTFIHTAAVVDGLEGYPVFLPPRSMAQAEFIEVLERLAGGWKAGIQPHSLEKSRAKGRLAIEDVPVPADVSRFSSTTTIDPPKTITHATSSSSLATGSSWTSQASTNGAGSSSTSTASSSPPPSPSHDLDEALDQARILLAPVARRQRERVAEKAAGGKKKPAPISIPLHGPRVEIILAWLGAVHLPELEGLA